MEPKIFISYNQNVDIERSTAMRLQTIASLYGAHVMLPDRLGNQKLKEETQRRIRESDVFIMFATAELSPRVIAEVNYAINNGKRVVIFKEDRVGRLLEGDTDTVIEIPFNAHTQNVAEILNRALEHGGFVVTDKGIDSKNRNNAVSALVGSG